MFRIVITAGTQYDSAGLPVINLDGKLAMIRKHIADQFGGYTETATRGGWLNPANGSLVEEPGTQWIIYADQCADPAAIRAQARKLAGYVAAVLNQECVCAEVQATAVEFVPAAPIEVPAIAA